MRGCKDAISWRWENVKMRCEDEMWRWENILQTFHYWKNRALRRSREERLDDGWPKSVEEQGLLLEVWRRKFRNDVWNNMCYRQSRRGVLRPNSEKLLHTVAFTQTLLHTNTFTHRRFYTQTLLHTEAFTHKHFYTQTLLHTNTFTHRCEDEMRRWDVKNEKIFYRPSTIGRTVLSDALGKKD